MTNEYWLYDQITESRDDREPRLALLSTVNWARVVAFEIVQEHGSSPKQQFESSLKNIRANFQGGGETLGNAAIFEPLFASLNFALSVASLSDQSNAALIKPWLIPSTIVSWYYAIYNSFKAIYAACNIKAPDTHSGAIKTLSNTIVKKMPHPFNMQAEWVKNEEFTKVLPSIHGETQGGQLISEFDGSRACAQKMLIGYLSGTTKREVDIAKERIANKNSFPSFRAKEARAIRDKELEKMKINFLSCAYRYRGKANYRDAIYISYGVNDINQQADFLGSLATSGKFAFINALAVASFRLKNGEASKFLRDVDSNMRGLDSSNIRFWDGLIN